MVSDNDPKVTAAQVRRVLLEGEMSPPALVPQGSNYTFLVKVTLGSQSIDAIYKPRDGERPLWDFPPGTLYLREYAAYLVSQGLSWDFIPCTVIRSGPYGVGSVQQFIEIDPYSSYFTIREEAPEELEPIALFDCLSNNADRKASHCFRDTAGSIWSIDHGLTFHPDPKLRTVIWDFEDEPISASLLEQMERFVDSLHSESGVAPQLHRLLDAEELSALSSRIRSLLRTGRFPPQDPYRRNVPWPWF
ncbi:MAG: SCO1664 family protein [Chloroflexota bacterium]|nr:SCO1664 family protein [Chloroflexota bacterium]MDE2941972.1 SCO1664 family protein [Chloroflexota bacterium]MDE3267070.1 SCO1664 family protein [Chloroflexota bacterium]